MLSKEEIDTIAEGLYKRDPKVLPKLDALTPEEAKQLQSILTYEIYKDLQHQISLLRRVRVTIRLTPQEYALLADGAKWSNQSVSEFIRGQLFVD